MQVNQDKQIELQHLRARAKNLKDVIIMMENNHPSEMIWSSGVMQSICPHIRDQIRYTVVSHMRDKLADAEREILQLISEDPNVN